MFSCFPLPKPVSALALTAMLLSTNGCTSRGMVPPNTESATNNASYPQSSWKVTQIASGPGGPLAVDADDNVYVVADNDTNEVEKVHPDGKVTQTGHGFLGPAGVTVYNGDVYVADAGHDAIKKVAKGGSISVAVKLKNPAIITVDKQGAIYAVQLDACKGVTCINKITPNGNTTTVSDLAVDYITLDTAMNLYAVASSFGQYACCASGKLYKITPNGNVSTRSFKGLATESVAVDADSNVYVGAVRSEHTDAAVYKISPNGTVTKIASLSGIVCVCGLAFRDGALYAAGLTGGGSTDNAVYKITP